MFVVVFIKSARKYVVVPESWIYDIDRELLKNKGVNRNRDVLVFWSLIGLVDGKPNEAYEPNFHVEKATEFPLPNDVKEACFISRLIRYFGKKKSYLLRKKIQFARAQKKQNLKFYYLN